MSEYHVPVMLDESVTALITNPQGTYADCTFGGGGHTAEILSRLQDGGRVIAFDRDSDALANAPDDPRLTLVHNNFRFIENYAELLRREEPGKRVFPSEPMATLGHVRGRDPACREGSRSDGPEENPFPRRETVTGDSTMARRPRRSAMGTMSSEERRSLPIRLS